MCADNLIPRTRRMLESVFGEAGSCDFVVRFWDGSTWGSQEDPRFSIVLNRPDALGRMLSTNSDLGAGEAFIFGDIDIEGDLEALFSTLARAEAQDRSLVEKIQIAGAGVKIRGASNSTADERSSAGAILSGRQHSRERDREAISYHYDVSNRFYSMWLDEQMVYSCGYFPDATCTLDEAQTGKLDHICRKLRLSPGDRLLDIGCGWGALVMHAAEHYGVEAVGVTLSNRQFEFARDRIVERGLQGSARVELLDYRDASSLGTFDKIASIGMFEHVGKDLLPTYFRAAFDALRPGGLFLNHGIARGRRTERKSKGPTFGDIYVFPDGELVPISHALDVAEHIGLEVRDVESLREHYATTLRHWVRNLEERQSEAIAEVGDVKYRIWRLFMSASAHGFSSGDISVYQTLLSRPREDGVCELPPTRDHIYA